LIIIRRAYSDGSHHATAHPLMIKPIYVVETEHADYLFACQSGAQSFARTMAWPWIDWPSIHPVPLGSCHRFSPESCNPPLVAGKGQEKCRRIQRHVKRWFRERDEYW